MSLGTPRRTKMLVDGRSGFHTRRLFRRQEWCDYVRRQAQVTESHSEPRDGATREELRLTQLASCAG